jgi:hypothetical protein
VGESGAIAVLAEATANRLRLLQRDLADERSEDRASVLTQEVKDAVSKVIPEQRRQFLEELRTRFPSFDGVMMPQSEAAPALPSDPLVLFDRLANQSASLSAAEKQAVVDRLREAGFPVAGPAASPDKDLVEVSRLLQMGANVPIEPARAAQLLFVLVDFLSKLDQAAWSSWSQIAPDSEIRKNAALQRAMGRFLKGEITRQQFAQESDRLLRLTASLIVSLQRVGPGLFRNFFDPVSPATIKEEAVSSGLMRSRDAQWWKIYEDRAGGMDAGSFNTALFTAVARFVKDFFQPGGMPPAAENAS